MLESAANAREDRKPGRNRQLVFDVLTRSEKPMSAYELLAVLRDQGLRAPLQVYRALDRLIEEGLVHKIESLSAFALCVHPETGDHGEAAFTICTNCGQTSEVHDTALERLLRRLARKQGFRTKSATVEFSGLCKAI